MHSSIRHLQQPYRPSLTSRNQRSSNHEPLFHTHTHVYIKQENPMHPPPIPFPSLTTPLLLVFLLPRLLLNLDLLFRDTPILFLLADLN